jgi:hypothetical protein
MKTCRSCGQEKEESEFNSNKEKRDGLQAKCRECNSLYLKQHYIDNKSIYNDNRKKRKVKITNWLHELKSLLKCCRCDESYIACLDFHHTNPEEKEYNISYMANIGISKDAILKEISKCIILCANCHRKEHHVAA